MYWGVPLVPIDGGVTASVLMEMRGVSSDSVFFLGLVNHPGQPPVEHDHLAELAHHHVIGLEVAVDHAPAMGVADRLADVDEGRQQLLELAVIGRAAVAVELGDRLAERPAVDEFHRVERMVVLLAAGELIDRHDVGVLELAGDLRLLEEASPVLVVAGLIREDLLERDHAVEVAVAGDPDLPRPPSACGRVRVYRDPS